MLQFRVFAADQLRPSRPSFSPFLRCSHSTPFFSVDCALFSAMDDSQPFIYQSLPHSSHRDGGCTPHCIFDLAGNCSSLYSTPFFSYSSTLFCTHKNHNSFFSIDSALFAKNNRGWGTPQAFKRSGPAPAISVPPVTSHESLPRFRARPVVSSLGAAARKSRLR
jgi:hypothetical protein